jgi:hypothetical protein
MVIQKIIVKPKRHIHAAFKNIQEGMHDEYFNAHVGTHRRVNQQVQNCLEEIGD